MRIAFPSNDGIRVEEHFGHCGQFILVDVEDGQEIARNSVPPPQHAPGVFPAFLAEKKADVIITGGMGGMAVNLFKQNGIEVILGASGTIEDNLAVYLSGNLESTGSSCTNHEGGCH